MIDLPKKDVGAFVLKLLSHERTTLIGQAPIPACGSGQTSREDTGKVLVLSACKKVLSELHIPPLELPMDRL